jgi:hypothetical protein
VPENLPKEASRQVAFGQLEDEVPRMSDEAPAGLPVSGNKLPEFICRRGWAQESPGYLGNPG